MKVPPLTSCLQIICLDPPRRCRPADGSVLRGGRASGEAPGWQGDARRGLPRLAPVILPSHSSAADINNNGTSGFTLLSRVNPFRSGAIAATAASSTSPSPLAVTLHSCVKPLQSSASLSFQLRILKSPSQRGFVC